MNWAAAEKKGTLHLHAAQPGPALLRRGHVFSHIVGLPAHPRIHGHATAAVQRHLAADVRRPRAAAAHGDGISAVKVKKLALGPLAHGERRPAVERQVARAAEHTRQAHKIVKGIAGLRNRLCNCWRHSNP